MQSHPDKPISLAGGYLNVPSGAGDNATLHPDSTHPDPGEGSTLGLEPDKTLLFEGQYTGQMDMAADVETVAQYLNSHQGWFTRCAHPMVVEPISDHGYALVVGHFSMLGYDVEPKVGLYLAPVDHRVYRINTIPIPGYVPPGYDVDFKALMRLEEDPGASSAEHPTTGLLTRVDWELSLAVKIQLPRALNALPHSLLKTSGDRLLNQVVRQVSKRLTRKVQEDFHSSSHLPLPPSYHRHYFWSNWGKRS
ncbi:MAG: DUF1997 domain-containing protein [Leptolyngbyaceae cyanobacterium SM2_3_12]|nr:DUF1997 domain-containing protein [Leptolyngbyaceae cyanobacterium SM2_3_12]